MAERRMFAKTIIDSDAFLDMSVTARLLYYDLAMRADDDGFINSPKKIMRMVGASEDDLRILAIRKFIIPFDSGIVVIKHWRIHNYIRKDMYHETKYKDERAMLALDENNAYTSNVTNTLQPCIDNVTNPSTQDRLELDKDRVEINNTIEAHNAPARSRFNPPTANDVAEYVTEKGYHIDPEAFVDYYTSKGWKVGNNPMKDWKAAVRTWERRDNGSGNTQRQQRGTSSADLYGSIAREGI